MIHVRRRLIGAAAVLALIATACGSEDNGSSATDAPTPDAPTETDAAPGDTTGEAPADTAGSDEGDAAWNAVVAAAEAEGAVTWYTAALTIQQIPDYEAAFAAAYPGIDIEIIRQNSPEVAALVAAETESGDVIGDVVSPGLPASWFDDLASNGYLATLEPSLPALNDPAYNDAWVHSDATLLIDATPFGYGWNTDELPDGVDSCEDFVDPSMAGRVGVVDPTYPSAVAGYLIAEENCGEAWLEQLGASSPRILAGALPLAEALGAGEVAALTWTTQSAMESMRGAGAPVEFFLPDNPFTIPVYSAALEGSPHPNAAQVLLHWLSSPEADQFRADLFPSVGLYESTSGTVGFAGDLNMELIETITPEVQDEFYARWESWFR